MLFSRKKRNSYYALVEGGSDNLIILTDDLKIISYLSEFVLDSIIVPLTPKGWLNDLFLKKLVWSEEPYLFRLDQGKKKFFKNTHVTESVISRINLIRTKYILLGNIINDIENYRKLNKKNILFQETIYTAKREEAIRFKEKNYPEDHIYDYPYVLQYANMQNISYKNAADSIILKAKLEASILARTEALRLKYLKLIKEAQSFHDLKDVYKNFNLDFYVRI